MKNPYTKPGCLKVSEWFRQGLLMPFFPGEVFASVGEMMATFDRPELLEVVEAEGMQFLRLREEKWKSG